MYLPYGIVLADIYIWSVEPSPSTALPNWVWPANTGSASRNLRCIRVQRVAGFWPCGNGILRAHSMWLWMNILWRPCVCVPSTLPCRASCWQPSTNPAVSPGVLALAVPVPVSPSSLGTAFRNNELNRIHCILRQEHTLWMITLDIHRLLPSTWAGPASKVRSMVGLSAPKWRRWAFQESPIRWLLAHGAGLKSGPWPAPIWPFDWRANLRKPRARLSLGVHANPWQGKVRI